MMRIMKRKGELTLLAEHGVATTFTHYPLSNDLTIWRTTPEGLESPQASMTTKQAVALGKFLVGLGDE